MGIIEREHLMEQQEEAMYSEVTVGQLRFTAIAKTFSD